MYIAGEHIQYLIITYDGKESEKEFMYYICNTYRYMTGSNDVYPKHCKSTILQLRKKDEPRKCHLVLFHLQHKTLPMENIQKYTWHKRPANEPHAYIRRKMKQIPCI